jgi:hypothetical protein
MRAKILIAVFTICLSGCDMGQPPVVSLTATFYFYDARGVHTSVFRSVDNFTIGFIVRNTTDKVLTYYRGDSSPDVIFRISQGDSVVASSIDGYSFVQIPSEVQVQPGETLMGQWTAPNTPARVPKIVLRSGIYEAHVIFRRFSNAHVDQPPPMPFTIIE